MPSVRPTKPSLRPASASPRRTRAPSARAPAQRPPVRRIAPRCGEARAFGRDHHVDVADPPPAIALDPPRDVAQEIDRRHASVLLVGRREQRAEIGEAGRAEQRVGHRVGDGVGVGVTDQGRSVEDSRHPGRAGRRRRTDARRSRDRPGSRAASRRQQRRAASSRSSGPVTFRLVGSPATTTTEPPAASTSAASSVPSPPRRGPPAAPRRGTPAGSAPSPGRRGDRRDDPRTSTRLIVSETANPGTAPSAPASTASMTARRARRRERAGGVVHHHDLGVIGNARQTGAHRLVAGPGTAARPAVRPTPPRSGTTTTPSQHRVAAFTARSTSRSAPIVSNCFAPPKRAPEPAATTIAQVCTR